jgi:hypothetical protein
VITTIIIIPLGSEVLLRVKSNKIGTYDLQWLHRYAAQEYAHTFCYIYIFIYVRVFN